MRIYEEKQVKNRHKLNQHFEQVYSRIPEIRDIDDSVSLISLEQAKKLLDGDDAALDNLKEQLQSLSGEKARLLADADYPADYLEPIYDCPDCKDTGYIGTEKCHCFRKAIIDLFYTRSHLEGILKTENFDYFSFDYYSKNYIDRLTGKSSRQLAEEAYRTCRDFVDSFDNVSLNLLLFGTTGCGKTFLTHCIAKEVMESIHSVLYLTATEFVDAQMAYVLSKSDESAMLCEQIQNCDLLIIDDLGTERNTEFVISQLFVCLNERILNQRSTIISTNFNLEEIKNHYTERTFSRISNHYKMIRLAGDDIRIQKKLMNREEN